MPPAVTLPHPPTCQHRPGPALTVARARREAACPNQDRACLVAVAGHHRVLPGLPGGDPALMLAVVADAVFSLSFLLGYATIGASRDPAPAGQPIGCRGGTHNGRQVTVVSYADR
jgi:hypothetical protein